MPSKSKIFFVVASAVTAYRAAGDSDDFVSAEGESMAPANGDVSEASKVEGESMAPAERDVSKASEVGGESNAPAKRDVSEASEVGGETPKKFLGPIEAVDKQPEAPAKNEAAGGGAGGGESPKNGNKKTETGEEDKGTNKWLSWRVGASFVGAIACLGLLVRGKLRKSEEEVYDVTEDEL